MKISWMDIGHEDVLVQINIMRILLKSVLARKHRWIGQHILRHDKLFVSLNKEK